VNLAGVYSIQFPLFAVARCLPHYQQNALMGMLGFWLPDRQKVIRTELAPYLDSRTEANELPKIPRDAAIRARMAGSSDRDQWSL
jgi:hypothetical protein